MVNQTSASMTFMILQSYPNACVLYIKEVVNPKLLEAYTTRYEQIKAIRGNATLSRNIRRIDKYDRK